MKTNRFNDFIHLFLVNASQMAYIEEAQKTYTMLHQFNELFRYMIRKENTVMLSDEIKALRLYSDIQSIRYAGRFSITIDSSLTENDIAINHLCLLGFMEDIMEKALGECEDNFCISMKCESKKNFCITADLEHCGIKQSFKMDMPDSAILT